MVDFNNNNTVATAPKELLNILIIEHYYYLIDAFEKYDKLEFMGADAPKEIVKSKLYALFRLQKKALEDSLKPEDFQILKNIRNKDEYIDLETAFDILNAWLYTKGLIKVDDRELYDFTDPFEENRRKGYR